MIEELPLDASNNLCSLFEKIKKLKNKNKASVRAKNKLLVAQKV